MKVLKYHTIYADPPWKETGGAGSSGELVVTTRS